MTRLHYASTKDSNMLYLVQYRITDPFFYLEIDGKQYIFLSSVDIDAFRESGNKKVEAVAVEPLRNEADQHGGDKLGNLAKIILDKYEVREDVRVPANFPIGIADFLRENSIQLKVQKKWCSERMQKSPKEISAICENFEHTKKAYDLVEKILKDSEIRNDTILYDSEVLTSEFLKREVSKLLLEYDLENSTGLIISCGKYAAMPHHSGEGPILPHQTIIVDIFPQSLKNHYFADMTRTYVKGEPSDEIKKMYEAVQEAQLDSLAALAPNKTGKEIYEISADIIKKHGFDVGDAGYIHSLGHGLGLDIHEAPNLGPKSDSVLQVGNVVTIEPGLYYPDVGGIRIEDTVVITKNGCENLTNYPQNWIVV